MKDQATQTLDSKAGDSKTGDSKTGSGPKIQVSGSPTRCPYCHENCADEDQVLVCETCLSRHHEPCWTDHGACSSCGGERALQGQNDQIQDSDVNAAVSGPHCRSCGTHGRLSYTCPCCDKQSCSGCYRPRFRRCIDCATDLIRSEKRLELVRARHDRRALVGIFAAMSAIAGFILTLVFVAESERIAAFICGPLGFLSALVALWCFDASAKTSKEIEELELELAPFQQTLTDKVVEGVKNIARRFGA